LKTTLIIYLFIFSFSSFAKVDPPNYDFSLKKLQNFMPGKTFGGIKKTYPKSELYSKNKNSEIYKYYISHFRYKFPVFVQFKNKVVTDFFARLPSYFSHDIFHQSLINRYKLQDKYNKYEESAVYTWNNIKGNRHIYFGSCTITCFPIYYTVIKNGIKITPIIDQLSLNKINK
jgi:hypothetical protein